VILAEDVPKYLEYAGERNDPGGIVAGSRQIYLTFPAESTFTEQDVSNYFRLAYLNISFGNPPFFIFYVLFVIDVPFCLDPLFL